MSKPPPPKKKPTSSKVENITTQLSEVLEISVLKIFRLFWLRICLQFQEKKASQLGLRPPLMTEHPMPRSVPVVVYTPPSSAKGNRGSISPLPLDGSEEARISNVD